MKKPQSYLPILLLAAATTLFSSSLVLQAGETTTETSTTKSVTFLGVESQAVSGAIRAQLDIPAGMGLSVAMVVQDSAAGKAGLQRHDILLKMDDQWLINNDQLGALIRSHEAGESVTLTILRKGKEQELPVILGSHEVAEKHFNWTKAPHAPDMSDWDIDMDLDMEELQEQLSEIKERAKDMGNMAMEYIPEIVINKDMEDGGHRTTSINLGNRSFVIVDDKGSVKMTSEDGATVIKVEDPDGNVLYDGKKPDEEALKQLPEEVQERILLIEEQDKPTSLEMLKQLNGKNIKIIINTNDEEAMLNDSTDDTNPQHG